MNQPIHFNHPVLITSSHARGIGRREVYKNCKCNWLYNIMPWVASCWAAAVGALIRAGRADVLTLLAAVVCMVSTGWAAEQVYSYSANPFRWDATLGRGLYEYQAYNNGQLHPQLTGWPVSLREREVCTNGFVAPSMNRNFSPTVPTPQGAFELDIHENLVKVVKKYISDHGDVVDVLLVGDSITAQWCGFAPGGRNSDPSQYNDSGTTDFPFEQNKPGVKLQPFNQAWNKYFRELTAVNIGVGGDRTQSILWRLDHGGADGLNPKVIILGIGHNNMGQADASAVAKGIVCCAKNLRGRFPNAEILLVKILPHTGKTTSYFPVAKDINTALDLAMADFGLSSDPQVHLLPDMWNDWLDASGEVRWNLFVGDKVHPSQWSPTDPGGYELYASKLNAPVKALLDGPGRIHCAVDRLEVSERDGSVMLYVRRLGGESTAASVQYLVEGSTITGRMYWAAGDVGDKVIRVPIVHNVSAQGDQQMKLILSDATGSILGVPTSTIIDIRDAEQRGVISLAPGNPSWVQEGGGPVTLTVQRKGGRAGSVSVSYATQDGAKTTLGALTDEIGRAHV